MDACDGTLSVPGDEGEVFALCEGLAEDPLLALGQEELFEDYPDVCTVVEVRLDPAFVLPGNSTIAPMQTSMPTVMPVKARATYFPRM